MTYHSNKIEDVLHELNSNATRGLNGPTARSLLATHGENKLTDKKKKTILQRFLDQFKDVMIIILLIAAFISFGIAIMEQNAKELFEPALILAIVILNAILGVAQENKAEQALEALKNMTIPTAKVIRDGVNQIVDSANLVPGDIIYFEAGDAIPADARLLSCSNLKVDESMLTGESVPADKDHTAIVKDEAPLGDRINMVYSGCAVSYGTGSAVVVATGMNTQMGRIAGLLNNEEDSQTPLQSKLAKLGTYLGIMALAACFIVFGVGVSNGIPILEIFMTSVSLAVSAIPEGLPAIVTVVLSIGVQRMVSRDAIIRRLPAVETLGSASVICSDKTGTLTQNKMTLVSLYTSTTRGSESVSSNNSAEGVSLLQLGTLCSNGTVTEVDGKEVLTGDPTETAIVSACKLNGITKESLEATYERIVELPFDSDRKLMTVVVKEEDNYRVITKGAFDSITKICDDYDMSDYAIVCDAMSNQALRVIAVASKVLEVLPEELTIETLERGLCFEGLLGMIDPPRVEAKEAVAICKEAGIKPVMITGDHILTAKAIAGQLGIFSEGDNAITGVELDTMSETELDDKLTSISVYARVSPENKIRIVKAWQKKGQIVAMTGDGVNDAPALKAADIGCAMGITGTDVAKSAADITLTDDNFATIVDAVEEGRGIYDNIKKVVGFLLGTNIGEVVLVFLAMILWHQTPLLSMQLLWINLVTDSLPAIALGMEAVEKDVMTRKPKSKDEGIFANGYGIQIILQGFMFGLLALLAFYLGWTAQGVEAGRTLAFMTLSTSQIIQAFNMRSNKSLFKTGIFTNSKLNKATAISITMVLLVLFTPLSSIFGLVYLTSNLYAIGVCLALVPVVIMELMKSFMK